MDSTVCCGILVSHLVVINKFGVQVVKIVQLVMILTMASLLTACANRLESVDRNPPAIGEFQQALHKGYIELARAEYDEYDRFDGYEYVRRAAVLADGGEILPEEINARNLPTDRIATFTSARARLMKAIQSDATDRKPLALASAQLNFDCWMQEQEENNQLDQIKSCQEGFIEAIEQVEYRAPTNIQNEPTLSSAVIEPSTSKIKVADKEIETGHIYFEYNDSTLTEDAVREIDTIVGGLLNLNWNKITLEAHTDTSGTHEFNMDLAQARAENVKELMISKGISADLFEFDIQGENNPIIDTGDGVKEPENRQVIVIVK